VRTLLVTAFINLFPAERQERRVSFQHHSPATHSTSEGGNHILVKGETPSLLVV
jgi:hypothetical protein